MTDLTERLRKGRLVKAAEPMNIGEHGIAWSGEVRELCHPDALEAATTLETLTQENARLKAVSEDHFRNAQRLAGEVAKRDVENARLREAGWRDIETIEAQDKCLLWCSDLRWEDQRQPEGGYKRVIGPVGVVMGSSFDYLGDGRITVHGMGMNGDWTFTHWMPLPPAPARKALGGGNEQ